MAERVEALGFSPISGLSPAVPSSAEKKVKATVTLLWPYSSSTKSVALLLAEPDFRLRKERGQIRVRFLGPSAQAVARSQVGIGDGIVLSLSGAKWTEQTAGLNTPGKSLEAELSFQQRVSMKVIEFKRNPCIITG